MRIVRHLIVFAAAALFVAAPLAQTPAQPATPPVTEGDFVVRNYTFQSGEVLPEVRLHYRTLGTPRRNADGRVINAVWIGHGTGGAGTQFLSRNFAGELFGPGQPLDATQYYIILPDHIGHGASSKPSNGLRAQFPKYGYHDMIDLQYRLITDGLGVNHLRLVMGTSMGGMHAWMWGQIHPTFMDALLPLASLPAQISGRNRVWRRVLIDAIRNDPAWNNGNYTTQPPSLRVAAQMLWLASSNPVRRQNEAPTLADADRAMENYVANYMKTADANDVLYYFEASRDYDPAPGLEKIIAPLVAINFADDIINPPELGILERETARVPRGRAVTYPPSERTAGHGTHTLAAIWKDELVRLLKDTALGPRQPVGEIVNPSAELVMPDGRPAQWVMEPRPQPGATPGAEVASGTAHAGERSLAVTAARVTWTNKTLVRPYASYKLTGWIKTEGVPDGDGWGARFELRGGVTMTSAAQRITGTTDWTRVNITFDTEGQDSFILAATLGAPRGRRAPGEPDVASGKGWFDDLTLELITARELRPEVVIQTDKTREPMPDLIYGQFIEHLGKSIYGGIWAEMLEDRKFYSAVGETRRDREHVPSPWRAVGEPSAVTMMTAGAFVGTHSPQVDLGTGGEPRGIAQSGLGVVAGKGYAGYVVLAGDASAAPVDVSVIWGSGLTERQVVTINTLTSSFEKHALAFRPGAASDTSTDNVRFEIVGRGRGTFRVGTASLMPDDNVNGMRRDTLELLKQLDAPIYRWPGGNFVSGYDWKDGIGDRDRRPPRKNPAWTGIEHNDFGMHEFFDFLREVKSQPFIAVNAGLGNAESAAQQVEYVNGGPDTPMGKLRAQHGRRDPWGSKYWAVGNEMSGDWQLGNVPIEEFVKRHNTFSQALLEVDPSLLLVASGEAVRPSSDWDRQLLAQGADYIHLNSKHFYRQDWHGGGLLTHVRQIGDAIRAIADAHREYMRTIPQLQGRDIRVALDEWNYWYGPHVFGELGTRYFLRDALGIAAGLNEYSRQTDVIAMANYAQTVNVIGAIKTSKTAAVLDSTGEALVMYRRHFGTIPVEMTGAPEPLDVAAAWTADRTALTISVVNPTFETRKLSFRVEGARLASEGTAWVLTAEDDMAFNEPGKPPVVRFTERRVTGVQETLEVAPASATIFRIAVR